MRKLSKTTATARATAAAIGFAGLLFMPAIASVSVSAHADITPSEVIRLSGSARVAEDIHRTISRDYWDRARCVVVIPELKKAAFIAGGEYGRGVMSCRSGSQWSAPLFMQLGKGSWGFQAGAEQIDVVLLVMNEQGVQKLLQNKVNLGADASIAAGPAGRDGEVATDAALKAEILSYSRAPGGAPGCAAPTHGAGVPSARSSARWGGGGGAPGCDEGFFAGVDLSGGVLRPDEDANKAVYGSSASPRTILASREISAPTEASAFLKALSGGASPNNGAVTTGAGESKGSRNDSPNDEDLRARVAAIQEALDRILADPSSSAGPTGTSGTGTPGGTITVDRERLLLLRQQLNAVVAALAKR
ncbi:MAG TPA: lipid-binding SYLF domain-containing protein [Vicinamibacterales bacterium]|nr:lipid-binding SYLF domain-containing protein [Vicinamibacterales bacterium]